MHQLLTATPPLWRQLQRQNYKDYHSLANFLELDEDIRKEILPQSNFILNLPKRLAEKIVKNTIDDPIFKQFVPLKKEQNDNQNFISDPVNDAQFRKSTRLLHKYNGRALLLTSSSCAMHCRYCFRKNMDYGTNSHFFDKELKIIKADTSLTEIILSGGDPLSLSNYYLKELILNLEKINHLERLRFHTRFPIGIPERIDEEFLNILKETRLRVWFVIHSNHPIEWDEDVLSFLNKIQRLGIPILNQSVLLKGVNDTFEIQKKLHMLCINHGIIPYYIHQLDKVTGASHFEVSEEIGLNLIKQLREELPGYSTPQYVREIPGKASKTEIASKPQQI